MQPQRAYRLDRRLIATIRSRSLSPLGRYLPKGLKDRERIVAIKRLSSRYALCGCIGEGSRGQQDACMGARAINAIGVRGNTIDGMRHTEALERKGHGQQVLSAAAATALPTNRDRALSARDQDHRHSHQRIPTLSDFSNPRGKALGNIAGLSSDRVAQQDWGDTGRPKDLCGGLQALASSGDQGSLHMGKSRVTWLWRLRRLPPKTRLQVGCNRWGGCDTPSDQNVNGILIG